MTAKLKLTLTTFCVAALAALPLCCVLQEEEDTNWSAAPPTTAERAPASPPVAPRLTFELPQDAEPEPKRRTKPAKPVAAKRAKPVKAKTDPQAATILPIPSSTKQNARTARDVRSHEERRVAFLEKREETRQRITAARRRLKIADHDEAARGLGDLMGEPIDLFGAPAGADAPLGDLLKSN